MTAQQNPLDQEGHLPSLSLGHYPSLSLSALPSSTEVSLIIHAGLLASDMGTRGFNGRPSEIDELTRGLWTIPQNTFSNNALRLIGFSFNTNMN